MIKLAAPQTLCAVFSVGILALSACATQGSSRYGDTPTASTVIPCGTVLVPCGQVIEYYPVQVQTPPHPVPMPCPSVQCPPTVEPPVIAAPPAAVEPPVVIEAPYGPPVVYDPPIIDPPAVVDDPVITCPDGTIPSYGGQDCIPITVPRK